MKTLRRCVALALALTTGVVCSSSSWPPRVRAFSALAPLSGTLAAASSGSANADATIASALPLSSSVDSTTTTPATSARDTARALPCLGFLLPNASSIVTSAHCATKSHVPYSVVLIGADHAPLLVTVTELQANALYREDGDDAAKWVYDAAVGSLDAPSQSDRSPVTFSSILDTTQVMPQNSVIRYEVRKSDDTTSEPSAGDDLSHAFVLKQSTVRNVANSECEAIAGKRLPLSGVLCGKSAWASIEECQSAAADKDDGVKDQLVTIKQGDVEYALGFIAQSFDCSTRDNSSLFVVTLVANLLLDPTPSPSSSSISNSSSSSRSNSSASASTAGNQTSEPPAPSSSGSEGSGSSADSVSVTTSVVQSKPITLYVPPVRSSSSSSGSSLSAAEVSSEPPSVSDVDADTDTDNSSEEIPDDLFSKAIQYPFVYLSDSMNASIKSVAAFHVSPTFLVTSSGWIEDQEQIKWVLFEDDKIRVKKIWLESDELTLTFNLMMVELERAYHRGGMKPLTARLEASAVLQLSFLDPASLLLQNGVPSDDNVHLISLDECGFGGFASAQEEGFSCVTSQWTTTTNSSGIVRMGFVTHDGQLVGLGSGHHKLGGTVTVPFFLLSAQMRLNFMLNVYVKSQKAVALTPDELRYRSSTARFFEDGFPVDCGGVLIAQDAVLTTATCALAHQLSMCVYGTGENTYQLTIAKDATVVHPLYSRGWARNTRYDFAIVKLERLLPASAASALASMDLAVGSEIVRVDLSSPAGTEACVVVESDQCSVSSESICAAHADRSQVESTSSSSTALVGTYRNKTVLLGFQSSQEGNFSLHSYSRIADATDFIYANVYGVVGSTGGGDEDGEDTVVLDEVLSASLRYPFAYLSDMTNASTESVAAFHISPKFLVANGDWIVDREQIKWVLFEDDKISVQKLWFQNDGVSFGYPMANFIVVIELERVYAQPGVQPVILSFEDASTALQLSFLDPALLLQNGILSDGNAHLASLDVCGLHDAATAEEDGVSCLTSEWHNANSSRAVQMGFVTLDGKLAGLVSGYQTLTGETKTRFLAISQLRRNFMVNVFMQSEQSVVLSPEEAMYRGFAVRFFEDNFPVECGGVVIATEAILTTASCALAHQFSFALWRTEAGSQTLETLPDIVVHPLYQAINKETHRYNFAIVKLASSLPERAVAALVPVNTPVGVEVVRVDLSDSSGVEVCAVLDSAVCIGSRSSQFASPSGLLRPSAPTGTVCAGNANGDGLKTLSDNTALLGTIDGTLVLVGLQAAPASNSAADSYASILDAADFVNANVFGRKWGDEPFETQEISDEVFFSSIGYPFVYASSSMNASVHSVAAVHISPSVVVMNAKWIGDRQNLQWVLFEDDKIAVQKYHYEGDYRAMMGLPSSETSSSYMMLIKLVRPYVRGNSSAKSPTVLLPTEPLKALEVKFLDPILLQRGLPQDRRSTMDSESACSLDEPGASIEGVECVHSTLQNIDTFARGTPMRMGFLLNGSVVSGLGTESQALADEISVPFARLDFEPRRNFIEYTTSLWSQEDVPSHDEMTYRVATVRLIAAGRIIDCGGMLIAPNFVLTTASCAQAHEITAALVGFGSNVAFSAIARNETVVHPLYQSGDKSTLRYNFAIIKLSTEQPDAVAIALAPFEEPVGSDVTRVELSGGTRVASSQVLQADKCSSGFTFAPLSLLQKGIICAGNESVAVGDANSASAALIASLDGKLVLVGLQVGPDDDPYADSYASVLGAANFINAFVQNQFWGGRRPLSHSTLLKDVSFMVGLRMTKSSQNFCGGVLIAAQFVLTAAHCVSDGLVSWATIGYNRTDPNNIEVIQVLADRIRIHPKFQSPNMYSFDAAILELATPAYSLPVTLDKTADFADGQVSTLVSYGAKTDSTIITLHSLQLPLWSQKKCATVVVDVDGSALCAGGQADKDACTGDSGSPLVIGFDDPVQHLVGLVSAGYGCGQTGVPGLYTRVSSILDFIVAYTAPVPEVPDGRDTQAPTTSSLHPASVSPVPSTSISNSPSTNVGSSGTLGSSSSSKNSKTTTPTPTKDEAPFTSAIAHQELPQTTEITRGKVVEYLLRGDDGGLAVSELLRNRLTDPSNGLTLYSSGDLSGILRVIAAYDTLPLNQREDRFGSVSDRRVGKQLVSAEDICR